MKAYCVKCKGEQEMKDAKEVKLKSGRAMMKGTCPTCGAEMSCILPAVDVTARPAHDSHGLPPGQPEKYDPKLLTWGWARDEIARMRTESQVAGGDPVVSVSFVAKIGDTETCPLCQYLDGMILDFNDKDLPTFLPPLHDGCRCIAMFNTKSMRESLRTPDYKRPPRELVERWLAPQRLVSEQPSQMTTEERLQKLEEGLAGGKTIRAEKVELVDGDGETRAMLALGENERPMLVLFDQNGMARAVLALGASGQPTLDLRDQQNGKTRAMLTLDKSGQPVLELRDECRFGQESGKSRAILALGASGQPMLVLCDQNRKNRAALFVDESGQPGLDLFDQNGKGRVVLNLLDSGQQGLTLLDQNGKRIWHAP